ncbi:hypothetical protein LMG22037_06550 [Paraburkholderia phenoliruptrix]|uniref:DUF2061 domain-containing protein n=1 Tax=Paraburkholderia phenoliruptrix TaxID=252970 RepID=A0A6J5CPY0_9BURK|nr:MULTISPECIES: DUF2061 domain-containing protein [Paraburkholderia]CAB3741987.1 hypothetical protein LMG22037_06550 [Paraburkholderia phenoliruptrix]HDR8907635.1 DUF2061 domain-containing protein [Burkholderia multivorans]
MTRTVSSRRSVVKAITYRVLIMCLDFVTIYLFTGTTHVAIAFMIVSNVYTSIGYLAHERIWARVGWGIGET